VVPAIIEIMAETMPKKWRQRTTPEIRFLTDSDHWKNSKKWGCVPGQEYPFDKLTYMNRWGTHQQDPNTWSDKDQAFATPVWINEFGWGVQALEKELGLEPTPQPEIIVTAAIEPLQKAVDWKGLQLAINDVSGLFQLAEYNGRLLDFSGRMALHRELCHRGQPNEWVTYLELLERLNDTVTRQLQPFLNNLNGKC